MVVFIVLLVIYMAIAVLTWAVGLALFQFFAGEDLRQKEGFLWCSAVAVFLVAQMSFLSFPFSYFWTLFVWWIAVKHFFFLPWLRAFGLFLLLALLSLAAYFVMLGVSAIARGVS